MKSWFNGLVACAFFLCAEASAQESKLFNSYILSAVSELTKERSALGYGPAAYTSDLQFGTRGKLKATKPPLTMCVAAQMEVIVTALNLYAKDAPDRGRAAYNFLPFEQWTRLRPGTLKGKVWLAEDSYSFGTAYALQYFGMGQQVPFEELSPGSFINLNRERTGHAVVFLAYLNRAGDEVPYDAEVAGFKYFSSQGSPDNGGFGYRYAFFGDSGCPSLGLGKKRDCGVIRSKNQRLLNTGVMLHPDFWDRPRRDQALKFAQATQKGPELKFDFEYFNGVTTDD